MKNVMLLLIFLIASAGCSSMISSKNDSESPQTLPRELSRHEKELVDAGQTFSYSLFKQTLRREESGNIFISPLSVSMALGMTLNGADGKTATAMKNTLALQGLTMPEINESYASLIKLLQEADPAVKMKLANSIWIRDGFPVKQPFKETGRKFFEARIEALDFSDPNAPDIINQWVSDHTGQLIDGIIEGRIPDEVVMYLINAIYFKGDWQHPFDPDDTQKRKFTMQDGSEQKLAMMSQKDTLSAYISDEVQLLDLPYGGGLFSMTLMMPAGSQTSIDSFVTEQLTSENMQRWLSSASVAPTDISLPKFEMEYKVSMNEILKSMGMGVAFVPGSANFSKISDSGKLFIDKVMHKSFLTVDEEGTEAAAATSVSIGLTSASPQARSIHFNRPFVFVIRERTSSAILFMGVMRNPEG